MYNSCSLSKHMDYKATLLAALYSYIPKQIFKQVDFKKGLVDNDLSLVQCILDNSNGNLRMYGSAEYFLSILQKYMNFPLRRKMFPGTIPLFDNTVPEPYFTLKGELLYCKQDYLDHLQACVNTELQLWDHDQKLKYAELIEYMKKHEERLGGSYEFIKYDHKTFEKIRSLFLFVAPLQVHSQNANLAVPVELPRSTANAKIHYIKVFNDLISKYPCLFLPNSETKNKRATAVVRVFYDNNVQFVMESELFAAINLKNPDRKPLECKDTDGHYRTIEYKRVLDMFSEEINDIDFMCHHIKIGEYRAVPIAAPTGDHCIQASDAFLDILLENMIVLGVFQKLDKKTYHMIPKFVAVLEKYFPSNIKYRYFINLKVFQKLRDELEEFWKPIEDKPGKKVRNVGPNGFTPKDFEKELKYLGYTEMFPEMSAVARSISPSSHLQNSIMWNKEMFVAIECYLVSVMFMRYPCFEEFMLRQKGCFHTRTEPCEYCLNGFKDAETRIEAEKKAEEASMKAASAQDSVLPAVKAKVSIDDVEKVKIAESPKESLLNAEPEAKRIDEPVTSQALSMIKSENKKESSMELSPGPQPPIPIVSKESSQPNPVSPDPAIQNCEKCKGTSNEETQRIFEEKTQKCEELEKTIKEKDEKIKELSEKETILNREKEDFEATVNKMLRQLVDKDKEINKLKKANLKSEKKMAEEVRKHSNSLSESEKRISQGLTQLKNKDSRIQELEVKNSRINVEKSMEIEKLKKQQESLAKEIEQMKRSVSKSTDELKKLTSGMAEKEAAENRLKQSNKELLEKLRKFDSSLQEFTKKNSHLETEITSKNRIIQELQSSAEKQVAEQEKAEKEYETLMSTIRGALDRKSPPKPKEAPECLICFYEIKPDQKTLKCEHCRKIVHFKCGSKWLENNRCCAHCRGEMLNPDEFPNLQ